MAFYVLPKNHTFGKNAPSACQSVTRVDLQRAPIGHWGDEPWDQAYVRREQERYGEAKERYVLFWLI